MLLLFQKVGRVENNMLLSDISKKNIERLGDREDVFVADIIKEIGLSETTLNPWKNKLVTYYELYKMFQRQKHYDGLAQLFVPEILRAIETIVGVLYSAVFGADPWFEYQGRTPEDESGALCETQLVNWQMDEGNFKMRVQDSFRQMAITGLTVRKLVWDFQQVDRKRKKQKIKTIQSDSNHEDSETVDEAEIIKDGWILEEVNLLGFYISDTSVSYYDIRKADWLAEEYKVRKHWLQKKVKVGWCTDNHFDEITEDNAEGSSQAQNLKDNLKLTSGYKSGQTIKGIMVKERWGLLEAKYVYDSEELKKHELDDDDMVEAVLIIINNKYLVKLEANPYWHGQKPYLSCPYVPQEAEFAGIGVCQITQSLQEELNDTRNQVMDNKTLNLMCMWLKDRASGIKNQDLRIRPNGVIPTNSMNGLLPLRPPVIAGMGVNIEGVVKNDLRESAGAPSNLQGIAQSGVSTATESTQINTQAMGRLKMTAQLYAELILRPMLVMVEFLNYQFYNQEKVIGVVGASGINFKNMHPDNIVGYKNVVIKLSTDLDENPGVKRQQLMQFLTVVQQMPPQLIAYHWKLLNKIYMTFFKNGHSLEDLYPAPEGQEALLDPKDENNVMIMGHHVEVKQGDDDKAHIQEHQKEFDGLKYALSEEAFKEFSDHLLEHHKSMAKKIQAQAQKLQEENMAAMQAQMAGGKPPAGNSGGSGQGINPGQVAGASAFTAPQSTNAGDLNQSLGT